MNKTVIMTALILSVTLVLCFFFLSRYSRYYLLASSKGTIYRIDRNSGQTWLIRNEKAIRIDCPKVADQTLSEEEKVLDLVKNSHVMEENTRTEDVIQAWLKRSKGVLKIEGWKTTKIDDQTYLVGYYITNNSENRVFFFEVNLVANLVRKISKDPVLEETYGLIPIKKE